MCISCHTCDTDLSTGYVPGPVGERRALIELYRAGRTLDEDDEPRCPTCTRGMRGEA